MPPTSKFLLVDNAPENRFLLAKNLLRQFPRGWIEECENVEQAVRAARAADMTAIVVHRAAELDGPSLVKRLRKVNRAVPIVLVSSREVCPRAIEAGATAFVSYDSWLRIGAVLEEILTGAHVRPVTLSPFVSAESHRWNYTPRSEASGCY